MYCHRCRSDWVFSCQLRSVSDSKRIRLTDDSSSLQETRQGDASKSEESIYYKWCDFCQTFHLLDWFFNKEFHCFDLTCYHNDTLTNSHIHSIDESVVPHNKRVLFSHLRTYFRKQRKVYSRLVERDARRSSSFQITSNCVICQKEVISNHVSKSHALPRYSLLVY